MVLRLIRVAREDGGPASAEIGLLGGPPAVPLASNRRGALGAPNDFLSSHSRCRFHVGPKPLVALQSPVEGSSKHYVLCQSVGCHERTCDCAPPPLAVVPRSQSRTSGPEVTARRPSPAWSAGGRLAALACGLLECIPKMVSKLFRHLV